MQTYLHHGSCLLGPTNADQAHRALADLFSRERRTPRTQRPNAVFCGPPCCASAVSRIRAWISPAWTSRTEIMRWGFPLYCTLWQRKRLYTFGPKCCEPNSYKTETERDLWRGDIKKFPTVASSLTSETLVDFRATGELWRTSERLLLYLKWCVDKRQRTVWQCDFQMLKENSKLVGESAKTTFIIISLHMHVRCAHMRHILPKACKQRPDKPVAILLDTKVLPGKRFAKREADGSSFSRVYYTIPRCDIDKEMDEVTSASTLDSLDSVIRIDYCKAGWNMLKLKVQAVSICKERRWLEAQSAPLLLAQGPEIRTGFFKDVSSFGWAMIGYLILLLILSLMNWFRI